KIFTYDMKRDSLCLFDDLANAGTGDGLSFTADGNVLLYATSTMEASTLALSGWTKESGTTVVLDTTAPRSGAKHLTGGSDVVFVTATGVAGIPIRSNTSYTMQAYTRDAGAGGTGLSIAIRWYTISGSLISTSTSS